MRRLQIGRRHFFREEAKKMTFGVDEATDELVEMDKEEEKLID